MICPAITPESPACSYFVFFPLKIALFWKEHSQPVALLIYDPGIPQACRKAHAGGKIGFRVFIIFPIISAGFKEIRLPAEFPKERQGSARDS
jgi:hypothetical protein